MPTFEYIVRTQDGKRLEGKIDANNINAANEKLAEKKFKKILAAYETIKEAESNSTSKA